MSDIEKNQESTEPVLDEVILQQDEPKVVENVVRRQPPVREHVPAEPKSEPIPEKPVVVETNTEVPKPEIKAPANETVVTEIVEPPHVVEEELKETITKKEDEFVYGDEVIAEEIKTVSEVDKEEEERLTKELQTLISSTSIPRIDTEKALDQKDRVEKEAEMDISKLAEKDSTVQKFDKMKEVSEELYKKRSKYQIYGGEDAKDEVASLSAFSNTLNKIRQYKIKEDKIQAIPGNTRVTEEAFRAQYLDIANSPIIARLTRIPVLLSGYYCEMSAADYGDMLSLTRLVSEDHVVFSRIFAEELKTIYKHLTWWSVTDSRPSFDEWLEKTYMPDFDQFFYGIFDATFPGETEYPITCGNTECNHNFTVIKENRALNFALERGITAEFIRGVIMGKVPVEEMKKTEVYKEAHTYYDKKVLPTYQYKVCYGIPTLRDIVEWINIFETELYETFEDFTGLVDEDAPEHMILKVLTHIKSVTVPVIVGKSSEGKDIINFYMIDTSEQDDTKRYENRRQIVQLLMALPKEVFRELFKGEEIQNKLKTRGMVHMLHNVECPNCKSMLVRIPLDMSSIFFTEATRTVRLISHF